jgi:hypothetical protein
VLILGISTPFVEEATSNIAEVSALDPVPLILTPCARRLLEPPSIKVNAIENNANLLPCLVVMAFILFGLDWILVNLSG